MIKKILPLSIFVLLVVVIILLGLQNMLNKNNGGQSSNIQPTLFQGKKASSLSINKNGTLYGTSINVPQATAEELQGILPIFAPNFSLGFSDRMQQYVLTTQNDEGEKNYNEWLNQNPLYINELQNVVITKQTIKELDAALDYAKKNKLTPEKKTAEDARQFTNMLNTLLNLPQLFMQSGTSGDYQPFQSTPTNSPSGNPKPEPTQKKSTSNPTPSKQYTYYSQCSGPYDSLPLPNGCNICAAGCGPTSVAMILSSYIDKSLTPPKTIALMDKAGVRIGCYGSYISEIYSYLANRGDLKVSDFIIPSERSLSAKDVAKDLAGYTKSGWTVFVLANFKTDGGGHYFWVTDVNDKGEILAYDPYYGKQQTPPISENRYSPAPYYRYAFAVKKS